MVTVIIPTFNEEGAIKNCLLSLFNQTVPGIEVIVVDDGSTDFTIIKIAEMQKSSRKIPIKLLSQSKKGPGLARNLGGEHASGKILVFVDADMTFDKDFIVKLTEPILKGYAIGTDSQEEYLGNPQNYWAKCWNLGRFAAAGIISQEYLKSMVPNKKDHGGIFRAVLKSKFDEVGGFELGGDYTDDESLAKKLGTKATLAKGAIFYHYNPDSLLDVWRRASWIGGGRNFTGGLGKKVANLFKFSPMMSVFKGLVTGFRYNYPQFVLFKVVYDTAIWVAVVKSL